MSLVGVAEIAELLGISKQRAHQIARNKAPYAPWFPEPVADLRMGAVWDLDDVLSWRAEHRPPKRTSRPLRETARSTAP